MAVGLNVMVDPALIDHRKVRRLAATLGVHRRRAFQLLVWGWCRVMKESPSGVLEDWSDDDIANAFDWDGELGHPETFVAALVDRRWLDRIGGVLEVHDWEEHQGKAARKRMADRERKREERERRRGKESPSPVTPVTHPTGHPSRTRSTSVGVVRSGEVRPGEEGGSKGGGDSAGGGQEVTTDDVPDIARVNDAFEAADITGPGREKMAHARAWLRRFTVDEVVHLVNLNPGLHIFKLDQKAFRDGPAPGPTVQHNMTHKGNCPTCGGGGLVDGGQDASGNPASARCSTCGGSGKVPTTPNPVGDVFNPAGAEIIPTSRPATPEEIAEQEQTPTPEEEPGDLPADAEPVKVEEDPSLPDVPEVNGDIPFMWLLPFLLAALF